MPRFLIKYTDPETQEPMKKTVFFEDTAQFGRTITAREWAEDYAYMLADKSSYTVTQIQD